MILHDLFSDLEAETKKNVFFFNRCNTYFIIYQMCLNEFNSWDLFYVGEAVHAVSEQGYCSAIRVEIQMTKIVEKHWCCIIS